MLWMRMLWMMHMRRLLRMWRSHGDGRVGGIRIRHRRRHGSLDGLAGSSSFARVRRRGRDVKGSEGIDRMGHVMEAGGISCNCKLRRRRGHWRRFDVALRRSRRGRTIVEIGRA